jgi:asparagine synthase (glutamine-hydrolysing)
MHSQYLERVVDLIEPDSNFLYHLSADEARERIGTGDTRAVREIEGSFALIAKNGRTVRMARSLDRPMRYFLAKRAEGPALVVASRIDAIFQWLRAEGLAGQFHPSYTRMVPAHHVVEIQLVGCPDPDPTYLRFLAPQRNFFSTNLDEIGAHYISALVGEIIKWLQKIPTTEPLGVCFSGGIDSGAVFVLTYHSLLKLGMNPARLKAFTLTLGDGSDVQQARSFLRELGLEMFLEVIEARPDDLDARETVRVVEDYKELDVESATMAMALGRGIRARHPDWRYLIDGDGGDENLKDYPIEENPELTIRSVVNNRMLYQEGWGIGTIKHSLTYSGGLSRSYTRTYAPARRHGFSGFSPFTRPNVVEVAEGIPFVDLTGYDVEKLYALKGEIVGRGIRQVTGLNMPIFPKRRFQHGATRLETLRERIPGREADLRREFLAAYGV